MAVSRRLVAVGLTVAALAIGGCSAQATPPRQSVPHDAESGGQTLAQMRAHIAELPGLTVTEADGGGAPNIKGNTGYEFALSVDPGYTVTDPSALVTFLVESAWSVREGYQPNTYVTISVTSTGADPVDIEAAAIEAGWAPSGASAGPSHGYSVVNVALGKAGHDGIGAKNVERLGGWPGPVPSIPAQVTAREGQDTADD